MSLQKSFDPENERELRFVLLYSPTAATMYGYKNGVVTDPDGQKRDVQYTGITRPDMVEDYPWSDSSVVWEGPIRRFSHIEKTNSLTHLLL